MGSYNGGANRGYYLTANISQGTNDPGNNRTYCYVSIVLNAQQNYFAGWAASGRLNINGGDVQYYGGNYSMSSTYSSITIGGWEGWIGHDANGNGTISVFSDFDTASSPSYLPDYVAVSASEGLPNYDRSPNPPSINYTYRDSSGTTVTVVSNAASAKNSGPGMTDYNFQYSTDNSSWSADQGMGTDLVGAFGGAGSTTNYYVRSRAYNSDGWSAYGASQLSYGFPTAPQSLTCAGSGSVSGRINLSWTTPSSTNGGITGYKIYRKLSTDASFPTTPTTTTTGTGTTYADDGLSRGVLYDYKITARNAVSDSPGGQSAYSNTVSSVMAPGVPTAPTLSTVVASTDTFGKVTLTWAKPSNTAGGIVDYYLYADGVVKTSVTGENTLSGSITGLNVRQTYSFTVRARNQFAVDNGLTGDTSNAISRKAPGAPTAPTSLTSEAPFFPPGTVDLDWVAPTDVGTEGGTITGYSIYLAGSSTPILTTTGTATSATVADLIPATTYTFNVRARNEIADVVGTFSDPSNSTTATAQGEPNEPTNLAVVSDPLVAGRLILTWTPPVGYNTGFRVYTGAGALVANISTPRIEIDGLTTNTSYSYKVRARNPLTDLTGSEGGPFSATVSGLVGSSSAQTVPSISVTNNTNDILKGTYNLVSTTPTTMSYSKTASNISFASVPTGGGNTVNNTNTLLNGSYVITTPTATSVSYIRSISDIPLNTSTPSGTMLNTTNVNFNGSYEVAAVPAPDPVTKTVSYSKITSDVSSRAGGGTITNNSNAVYNGEYTISDVTETTISYPKTNGNIPESDAFGLVYNKTNTDIFNGTFVVTDTPDHKTVEYSTGDLIYGENLITNPSMETVQSGTTTLRTNLVINPSFDTNVTNWTTSDASLARSIAYAYAGTHSGLVSPVTNSGSISISSTTVSGQVYTFSAWVYAEDATTVRATVTSPATTGATTTIPADTWTRISVSFTANSTSSVCLVQSVGSTQAFYVDAVLLEQTSELRPYFDGATTDALGWDYGWTGTANASTSTAKAATGAASVGYIPTDTGTVLSHTWSKYRSGSGSLSVAPTPVSSLRQDQSFATNIGSGGNFVWLEDMAIQSDGKIVIVGNFNTWNGTTVGRIVRLNTDGARDTTFTTNVGTGSPTIAYAMDIQSDGKILVGGGFTSWSGTNAFRIVRLNSDGTKDTTFITNTGSGANGIVRTITAQSDGKIVIGGEFTTWNGTTVNRIVRLNSDGTRDTTFTANVGTAANNVVYSTTVQSDGKIIVGGEFTSWNGTTVGRIVRLGTDGVLDTTFATNVVAGSTGTIYTLVRQSDDKIIAGGNFTSFSNASAPFISRLNADGTKDTTFATNIYTGIGSGPNNIVRAVAVQSDGKIVIGGNFTALSGVSHNRLARLNSDGTRDTAFSPAIGTAANDVVNTIAVQSDGEILAGGQLSSWNGVTVGGLVRIESFLLGGAGGVAYAGASVTSGSTYTFSGWVYSEEAISVVAAATNPTTTGSTFSVPANTWTRVNVTFTANNTTTELSITSTQALNFYVDDFMLQESSTLQAYFDGDTDATATTWPVVYSWDGTPHASVSTREVGGTLPEIGSEILSPFGEAARIESEAQLQIRYRSGWLG